MVRTDGVRIADIRLDSDLRLRTAEREDVHGEVVLFLHGWPDSCFSTIAAPTLLLWGERDALFPRSDQDRFVAALPHTRLKVYHETGHCPNWEVPDQVAADIAGFVQGDPGIHRGDLERP